MWCVKFGFKEDIRFQPSEVKQEEMPLRYPTTFRTGCASNHLSWYTYAPPPLAQALPCPSTGPRLTVVFLSFSVLAQRGGG